MPLRGNSPCVLLRTISIQFALRANFQGALPPGYPRRVPARHLAAAERRHLFTLHYSFFIRLQGASLQPCPICAPHFFFSLQEKKKRAAPGAKEKEGLGCKQRWTRASTRWSCAMWQACASFVQTRMPRPSLSAAAPLVRAGILQDSASAGSAAAAGDAEASQLYTKQLSSCRLAEEHL